MTPAIPGDLVSLGICIHAAHSSRVKKNHIQQAQDSTEKAQMLLPAEQ